MGTRKKVKYSIYLDPDDPLHQHLSNFVNQNAEAVRLMKAGFQVPPALAGAREAKQPPVVNVTRPPANVTKPATPTEPPPRVNVTKPDSKADDPGWDE